MFDRDYYSQRNWVHVNKEENEAFGREFNGIKSRKTGRKVKRRVYNQTLNGGTNVSTSQFLTSILLTSEVSWSNIFINSKTREEKRTEIDTVHRRGEIY